MKIFRLSPNKFSTILILMIYSNVFKLVNLYQPVAFLMDAWLILCLFDYVHRNGIKKKDIALVGLIVLMEFIGFLEVFNPNIFSLNAGFMGFRKSLLMWIPLLAGLVLECDIREINIFIKKILLFAYPILLYGVKQLFFYSSFDDKFISDNLSAAATNNIFGQERMTSIFSGASYLGTFAALIIILILYYWKFIPHSKKILYFFEIIISLCCIYGSLSRAAVLGGIVGIGVFFIWNMTWTKKISILLFSCIGLGITNCFFPFSQIPNWIYSENVLLRFIGSLMNAQNDPRFLARYTSLESMTYLIKKHIIIGYGVGSSQTGSVAGCYISTRGDNLFFSYVNEMGLFGLILLVGILLLIGIRLFNNLKFVGHDNSFYVLAMAIFMSFLAMMFSATISAMYPVVELAFGIIGLGCGRLKDGMIKNE